MNNVYVLNHKYLSLNGDREHRNYYIQVNHPTADNQINMMFKKYMSKISNTINTVNYLQHKAKENHHKRHLYDDGYDVQDIDPSTINRMEIDVSINGRSRRASVLSGLPANAQIVLSAAMANLRKTLLYYPLVLFCTFFFCYLFL